MATLTYSSAGIEVRIEPPTFEVDLARGAQQGEREEVCRRFVDRIGAEFSSAISQLLLSGAASEDFAGFEGAALQASHFCLRAVLQAGMESLDDGAARLEREGKLYRRVDPTPRRIMTSVGEVSYWRPRYRSDGKASIVPVDEQVCFAEGYFTELAAEQGVFLMSNLPPRDCVSLYEKLRIEGASLSSLQRLAETAGVHWEGCKEQGLAEIRAAETVPEAATTVCISLDGTMLPMLAEGKDGGKATSWKEASVGTLTCYDAEGERLRTLYLGQMPETRKSTLKEQLADELAHVLEFRPDLQVCAVADAAPDNWTFLSQYAPEEFQVVDVWHACQHLGAAAELIFPHDSTARERWFRKYRRILKDETEGVETVIRSLRYYYDKTGRLDEGLQRELNYFRNHRDRMAYNRHQDLNLPIGSGVTESACRSVIGLRMKRPGQRWGMDGGKAILAFRALVKSQRFDAAWSAILRHLDTLRVQNDNRPSHLQRKAA